MHISDFVRVYVCVCHNHIREMEGSVDPRSWRTLRGSLTHSLSIILYTLTQKVKSAEPEPDEAGLKRLYSANEQRPPCGLTDAPHF